MVSTIKDIAAHAGVSVSTVSFVINGKASQNRISDDIVSRVNSVAKRLNYTPNLLARGLRSGVTQSIGFVISDISNAFAVKLARQVEKEATKFGYKVFFASTDESNEKCIEVIDSFINLKMDGILLIPTDDIADKIKQLSALKIPMVLVDRYYPKIDTHYVITNNWQSAYDAVVSMIRKGSKRIATFDYETSFVHMKERFEGYKSALKDHNIRFDKRITIKHPFEVAEMVSMKQHLKYLIEECKVDALFFPTNHTALPGIQAIHEMDNNLLERMKIVCFDDNDFFKLLNPPITSLVQPIEELGKESVRILLDEIRNKSDNTIKNKAVYSSILLERSKH